MKKIFLFFFFLLFLLIPASAQIPGFPTQITGEALIWPSGYHYPIEWQFSHEYIGIDTSFYGVNELAQKTQVITSGTYWQEIDTTVYWEIISYNGITLSGYSTFQSTGTPTLYNLSIYYDGDTVTGQVFLLPFLMTSTKVVFAPAVNETSNETGIIVFQTSGLTSTKYFFLSHDPMFDPIGALAFQSAGIFDTRITTEDINLYYNATIVQLWGILGGMVLTVIWFFQTVLTFLIEAIYWISFIIMNLPMIVALGEVAIMFYSLTSTSTIFGAIRKWWKWNSNLLSFFMDFFTRIVDMVKAIKDSVPILRWF